MEAATAERLREYFAPHEARLEALLGADQSSRSASR
jgi:hypothetical protein